ncbi:MAG: outer membrane beta-barrel protein [Saprospiraceae bacterium]
MKNIYLVILLLQAGLIFGQDQFVLSGDIVDHEGKPMLFGNVILKDFSKKELVKITYVEEGKFQFDPLPSQKYFLEISCLGFEKIEQEVNLTENIKLNFSLQESSNLIEEVQVVAERDAIVNKNGNLKMNIANTNFASQPTTTSLLSLFPKIIVSTNGESISVIGKGTPLIYLGNRRITMDELNSINVNSIQDIELINNPSAKYEAEGRAVILIRRKKGVGDGLTVALSEVASWNREFNNYLGLNASVKKNKLELRTNFSYNQLQPWEGFDSDYEIGGLNEKADNSGISLVDRPQFVAGGGFYYQLNDGDYFSGNVNLRTHISDGTIASTSNTFVNNTLENKFETLVNESEVRSFFTSNINYNKQLTKSKSNIFFGIQYSSYIRNLDSEITNSVDGSSFDIFENRDQDFMIDAYAARVDFEKKIFDNETFEMGFNYAGAKAEAFSEFEYLMTTDYFSDFYNYSEENIAAYSQVSGRVKKVDYSFGLRMERASVEGGFKSADDLTIDFEQTIFFPKVMMNIPLDSSWTLTLNYAKTVARPNYLNSSSITTYITPFLEYTRNVNLQPSINEEISANFQYKRNSFELSYNRRKNPTFVNIIQDETTGRLISSPVNLEQERSLNLSIVNPFGYKKWSATNFVRFSIAEMVDSTAAVQGVTPSIYFYTRQQIQLPKRFSFGATFYGMTNRKTGVTDAKAFSNLDFFISKTFKDKFSVTLNFNDVYRGFEFTSLTEFNDIITNETRFSDRKAFMISMRYSFGKEFKSKYQNRDVDDNLNRMN